MMFKNTESRIAIIICTAMALGYIVFVMINLQPLVNSDHVSVNWNMLFIAGAGLIASALVLVFAIVMILLPSIKIETKSAGIIAAEAAITLVLSATLICQSLNFFGFE